MNVASMAISTPGQADFYVLGPQAAGALRRGAYLPVASTEELVEERIQLELAGLPAEVEAACAELSRRLESLREARAGGLHPPCLRVTPRVGQPEWTSPLREAWLADVRGDPFQGRLAVELRLRRLNYWEAGAETCLPLSNRNGSRVTDGALLWNHCDAHPGHDNWVTIDGSDAAGDLPAPLRLEVRDLSEALGAPGELIVVQSHFDGPPLGAAVIECGPAGAEQCSNGDYAPLVIAAETRLLAADLPAGLVERARGRGLFILGKWKEPMAAADVWMKPRLVSAGGVTLYNPAYSLARLNDSVIELGCLPLFEPPIDGAYAGLRLEIWGRKTSGSLETGLDYLMLAPPDGYRRYNPLPNADWSGASLVDCGQPQAYAQDAGGNLLPAFLAAGDPLQIVPGRGSCLTFQLSGSAGAAIQRQLSLRAWLRPRKRRL